VDPCKRETVLFLRRFLEDIALDGPPEIRWLKRASPPVGEGEALGVFPASFNPPTKAHLWILEEGRRKGLKELAVVLDKRPLDKEVREAELVDRLLMLLKLFGDRRDVSLGVSNQGLFLSKLRALQGELPRGARVVLLMGWDTLVRLLDPKYYEDREAALRELFSGAEVLVGLRGEASWGDLEALLSRPENLPFRDRISAFELPLSLRSVSSTEVRRQIAEGRGIPSVVPEEVKDFIRKRALYRG